jgi:hypothetical protein
MNTKRWLLVSCATAVAGLGCTKSEVDVDADIVLTGTLLNQNKQPLANALVQIDRSTNSACAFSLFGGGNWKTVKTGADGTFTLNLLGADARNGDVARCFFLRAPEGPKGSNAAVSFLVQSETVQIPPLQQWDGAVEATATTDGVSVTFQSISASHAGMSDKHTLRVEGTSSLGTIWETPNVSSPVVLSDYVLEDIENAKLQVLTTHSIKGSNTNFGFSYYADEVTLPRRARVPVSRGASCTFPDSGATCPLTNGGLTSWGLFQPNIREVVIQLARPAVLRKAVLRELEVNRQPTELVLEGSSDGTTWVPLANVLQGTQVPKYAEITLSGTTAVSQVRLRGTSTSADFGLRQLNELSLFE